MLTQDVLDKYHSRRVDDWNTCLTCLNTRDFDTFERIGHKLKGNGISFGYPELSKLGEELELAAQASDLTRIRTQVTALETWLRTHRLIEGEVSQTPPPLV